MSRNPIIDFLRFFAAVSVLCCHWFGHGTFTQFAFGKNPIEAFGELGKIATNGLIGVDIFFLISGSVIARSAVNRSASKFFQARFLRLAPIYFPIIILIALTNRFVSYSPWKFSLANLPANFFMLAPPNQIPFIDGSLWTLWYELRFYLIVGLLILAYKSSQDVLRNFALIAFVVLIFVRGSGWSNLNILLLSDMGPLFIGGMIIGLAETRRQRYTALLIGTCCGVLTAYSRSAAIPANGWQSKMGIFIFISFAPCILAAASWNSINLHPKLNILAVKFGLMSYPIYLLHQSIGISILRYLRIKVGLTPIESSSVTFGLILLTSYLLIEFYEPRVREWLQEHFLEPRK